MRIGYYAHHHGSGHCRQADKLAAMLPFGLRKNLTVFTSLTLDAFSFTHIDEQQVIRLNPEDERSDEILAGRAGEYWQPSSLHYSPIGNADIQMRSWQILQAIQQHRIELMIIDLSVEVAMLCRTASVPYLYVRLPGERDDIPHINAFAGAIGLLAAYPKSLEAAATPNWVTQKTLYLDFLPSPQSDPLSYSAFIELLTSFDSTLKQITSLVDGYETKPLIVTIIKGYGGHDAIDAKLPALRHALPDAIIISLGPINDNRRKDVDIAIEVDDVTPFIAHSDLLVMACGLNGIAQAYNYLTPLVVLPDERPHREQKVMAEALVAQGRALDWQQFMTHITKGNLENWISAYKNNADAYKDQLSEELSPAENKAAEFMNYLVTYSSAKTWFEEWFLLRIGLRPDSYIGAYYHNDNNNKRSL